jgi:hypothetical protein
MAEDTSSKREPREPPPPWVPAAHAELVPYIQQLLDGLPAFVARPPPNAAGTLLEPLNAAAATLGGGSGVYLIPHRIRVPEPEDAQPLPPGCVRRTFGGWRITVAVDLESAPICWRAGRLVREGYKVDLYWRVVARWVRHRAALDWRPPPGPAQSMNVAVIGTNNVIGNIAQSASGTSATEAPRLPIPVDPPNTSPVSDPELRSWFEARKSLFPEGTNWPDGGADLLATRGHFRGRHVDRDLFRKVRRDVVGEARLRAGRGPKPRQ